MTDDSGIHWLNLIELESCRGDWIHSKNIYSIDRIMDKLSLNGPSKKTIAVSIFSNESPETVLIWVRAKLINGAWMFSILEEKNVLV
jgi:hypothetical protein